MLIYSTRQDKMTEKTKVPEGMKSSTGSGQEIKFSKKLSEARKEERAQNIYLTKDVAAD